MSLTIDNQTEWNGRHLRSLCLRVIDATDGHRDRKIEIKTSKTHGKDRLYKDAAGRTGQGCRNGLYRGYAYYETRAKWYPIYMGVPKVERRIDGEYHRVDFDVVQFARVLEHEILHNQGLRHGEMIDDTRYCRQDVDHMDLDGITVEPKPSFEYRGVY